MCNKVFSKVSDFNASIKAGSNEVKDVTRRSPYFWATFLNKFASGDVSKWKDAEGSNLTVNNLEVRKLFNHLKGMHGQRYGFDFRPLLASGFIIRQDGQFVRILEYKGNLLPQDLQDGSEARDSRGREVRLSEDGLKLVVIRPVPCSDMGIFNLFKDWAKEDVKETEKADKAAAKAAAKAAREKETEAQKAARKAAAIRARKAKEISLAILSGEVTPEEGYAQLEALKKEAAAA